MTGGEASAGLDPQEAQRALELARTWAAEAGEILMDHLGRLSADQVRSKSAARDLVTAADLASERHLVRRLRAALPEHAIQAEEEVNDSGALDRGARWFLDPLDGTVNFVHRLPHFAVSMGLWVDGVPEVAVVHAPRLGETFWARRGEGAWLQGPGGELERLRVSTASTLGESVLGTGFPYRRHELPNNNLSNLIEVFPEVRGLRRCGSAACDLAYTAAGRLDAFWELHLSPHDVAAGGLLVLEAGGEVSDLLGGQRWLADGHVVAGPPALCALLRGRLKP